MRIWIKRILLIILAVGVAAVLGYGYYWANPMQPQALAQQALQSTGTVTVTDEQTAIVFRPQTPNGTGFIFYQGARVAPGAYAPTLHAIADQGYTVFAAKLPFNMALLGVNAADGIISANPQIKVWAIGGHSLGGVAASSYVGGSTNPAVKGLILFASYPASSLTDRTNLAIVSISGSVDGLATPAKMAQYHDLLPAQTQFVVIDGGDHAQFGDYGPQPGDNPAQITPQSQTDQIVQASLKLLAQISEK
jgi:pimeloyl-ACP methyl ester carboxylesterase